MTGCTNCDGIFCGNCTPPVYCVCGRNDSGPICAACHCPGCPKCSNEEEEEEEEECHSPEPCSLCNRMKDCCMCSPDGVQNIKLCAICNKHFCVDCRVVDEDTGICSLCAAPPFEFWGFRTRPRCSSKCS